MAGTLNISSADSLSSPAPFNPTASTLRYNAFWFLSLASSISCALSATLVQQWSRYYSQALDRRSAPHHRARIRSYLYEGITKYKMTAVIEFIPILLHMSVFLFFAGLIEFLMPINNIIGWITFGAGIVGGGAYTTITIFPVICPQCPYRTPATDLIWTAWQFMRTIVDVNVAEFHLHSLSKVREHHAVGGIPGQRDRAALQWVLGSIVDNRTMEAFVDGIPGFFFSDRKELGYDPCDVFDEFLRHSPVRLGPKIGHLLRSCSSGALSQSATERRVLSCLNALSTLTIRLSDKSVSTWMHRAWLDGFADSITDELNRLKRHLDPHITHYAHYTSVLMTYKWQREFLIMILKDLDFGGLLSQPSATEHGNTIPPTTAARLSAVFGVLEKLDAVQYLEEATGLKIMPTKGSGDIHGLVSNICELRKMLKTQRSPSRACLQILGIGRAASLVHFLDLLTQFPPLTEESHSMVLDILSVMSGHCSGKLTGGQDRRDLLSTNETTQLMVARAIRVNLGCDGGQPLSPMICDILIWLLASLGDSKASQESIQTIRDYHTMRPDSTAAQLALELHRQREGDLLPCNHIEWLDLHQQKLWPWYGSLRLI